MGKSSIALVTQSFGAGRPDSARLKQSNARRSQRITDMVQAKNPFPRTLRWEFLIHRWKGRRIAIIPPFDDFAMLDFEYSHDTESEYFLSTLVLKMV